MIGWLRGTLRVKQPPMILLDVQGVGYEVEAPMTTFYDLPELDQSLTLVDGALVEAGPGGRAAPLGAAASSLRGTPVGP